MIIIPEIASNDRMVDLKHSIINIFDNNSNMISQKWFFSRNGGTPSSLAGLFQGKSHLEMDENWGYPHFRKPPYMDCS